jgi:transposase
MLIGIARIMQTGWFKEVHVKDIDSHPAGALLASRSLLLKVLAKSSKTYKLFQ